MKNIEFLKPIKEINNKFIIQKLRQHEKIIKCPPLPIQIQHLDKHSALDFEREPIDTSYFDNYGNEWHNIFKKLTKLTYSTILNTRKEEILKNYEPILMNVVRFFTRFRYGKNMGQIARTCFIDNLVYYDVLEQVHHPRGNAWKPLLDLLECGVIFKRSKKQWDVIYLRHSPLINLQLMGHRFRI